MNASTYTDAALTADILAEQWSAERLEREMAGVVAFLRDHPDLCQESLNILTTELRTYRACLARAWQAAA